MLDENAPLTALESARSLRDLPSFSQVRSLQGIDLSLSDVMMSDICKSADLHFVGISLYSPRYKAKVRAAAIDSTPAARTPRKKAFTPSPEP